MLKSSENLLHRYQQRGMALYLDDGIARRVWADFFLSKSMFGWGREVLKPEALETLGATPVLAV